jgi:protein dithiol oxidoreductase (disulfide-forming)
LFFNLKIMKKLLLAIFIAALAFAGFNAVQAQQGAPKQGSYRALQKPQPADATGKVEVIEFFWYNCGHCNDFEPMINTWLKQPHSDMEFKRVPVVYRDDFMPQARTYYAFESLGKLEELHKKMFAAIHSEKKPLNTVEQISAWVATQGVDKDAFMKAYSSFSVQSKANRAKQLTEAFEIDGTPTMAVGGKYLTSAAISQTNMPNSLQIVEQLVAAVKAKKL